MITRVIGIDFGTSTSVVRVMSYQDGKPATSIHAVDYVHFNNKACVPTVVFSAEDGQTYFGYEAESIAFEGTLHSNFKMNLLSADKFLSAETLTRQFFLYLYRIYNEQRSFFAECNEELTFISYPAKWPVSLRKLLITIAEAAGFQNVTGVDEPTAALQSVLVYEQERLRFNAMDVCHLLMIDMGAGTTDLVLCRYAPFDENPITLLSVWPSDNINTSFGGSEIDAALCAHLKTYLNNCGFLNTQNFEKKYLDKCKVWKEANVSLALGKPDGVIAYCGFIDNMLEILGVERKFAMIDRTVFENILSDYLVQFPLLVKDCLDAAHFDPAMLDCVLLTGGHSQWYFVSEMLSGKLTRFGEINLPKIQEEPDRLIQLQWPQETVAFGLVFQNIPLVPDIKPSTTTTAILHILADRFIAQHGYDFLLEPKVSRRVAQVLSRELPKLNTSPSITLDLPYLTALPDEVIGLHETIAADEIRAYRELNFPSVKERLDELIAEYNKLSPDPSILICPKCQHPNPVDSTFCLKCGQRIEESTIKPTPSKGFDTPQPYVLHVTREKAYVGAAMSYLVDVNGTGQRTVAMGETVQFSQGVSPCTVNLYNRFFGKKFGTHIDLKITNSNPSLVFAPDITGQFKVQVFGAMVVGRGAIL